MGIGHLSASLALRGRYRRIPLLYLLGAGVLLDLLWGATILLGVEHATIDKSQVGITPLVLEYVPYTHSLVAALAWGALAGFLWWAWQRDLSGAIVLGLLVVSHWALDVVAHVGDIPLLPAGPLLGLGLWRSRAASSVVELGTFCGAMWLYLRATRARDRVGVAGPLIYATALFIFGAGAFFGPPLTSVPPLAIGNIALLLPLLLMDWVDRHREARKSHRLPPAAGRSASTIVAR